jgi:hypothetical protein
MNDVSTPDKLYRLSVYIAYVHGSMEDIGTYVYKVLIPATGHEDAITFAEELITRYRGHHKWRQDFAIAARLGNRANKLTHYGILSAWWVFCFVYRALELFKLLNIAENFVLAVWDEVRTSLTHLT